MGIITIIMVPTLLTLKVIIRINDGGDIFGFLCASHISSGYIWRRDCSNLLPIKKNRLSSFMEFLEFFTFSRYKSFTRYMLCKNFSWTVLAISFS